MGHQSGYKAADAEAILLVDVSNALNSLNHQAALGNIQHLCPPLFKLLIERTLTTIY